MGSSQVCCNGERFHAIICLKLSSSRALRRKEQAPFSSPAYLSQFDEISSRSSFVQY